MSLALVLILISIIFLIIAIFIPQSGILSRLKKSRRDAERVLVEDALKNLYDCEYNSIDCSLNSLSGGLSISADQTARLVVKLEELKLINIDGAKITLTNQGRTYALKVIRVHRLWERYLAEYTSVDEIDWHKLAELKEHHLTAEDVNELAAKLGNPLLDPHGDPIPSEFGEVPKRKEIRLGELNIGKFGLIVHVEDEPKEIYAQIAALGLHPGMQIRISEITKDRIRFEADGEECVLAPIFASYINVIPIEDKEKIKESFEPLTSLDIDGEAIVLKISSALRGQQRRRMLDLGIVPGTKITARLKSLGGDPTAYEVRGATIALRKNQSDYVFIKRINSKQKV